MKRLTRFVFRAAVRTGMSLFVHSVLVVLHVNPGALITIAACFLANVAAVLP